MAKIILNQNGGFSRSLERARQYPEYEAEKLKLKVADTIIVVMDKLEISRSELARKIKTSPANITKALRGYTNLRLETLANLAFALGYRWEVTMVPREEGVSLLWIT
ncbi:MAG: helix-turn-helix domain-containing protein, partial [Desulfatiglandales bacterium]